MYKTRTANKVWQVRHFFGYPRNVAPATFYWSQSASEISRWDCCRRTRLSAIRNIFAFAVAAVFSLGAEDWPQWRGPQHDGISSEKIGLQWPANGPQILWRTNVGKGFSAISISHRRVYTMGNKDEKDTIWCLDTTTGAEIWALTYASKLGPVYYEGGPGATPTLYEGRLFTISKWGDVFCLDAADGKIVWQKDLGKEGIQTNRWGFAGSPLIWKDLVILNAGGAGTALDLKTGKTVWSNGTNATGYASPVLVKVSGKDSVLIFGAKYLFLVDAATGKELWRHPWETGWDTNDTDPIPYKDSVFLSSYNRGCALLRLSDGQAVYESKALNNHLSPGVVLGEYLYAFNGEAKTQTDFRCIQLASGELKWKTSDPAFGSVLATGGKLLILSENGELLAAEASDSNFKPAARAQVIGGRCWTPPSLANGKIFVRNAAGDVVCLAAP